MNIRERPPLRLYDEIITPSGNRYRWGPDEPDPANVPSHRRDSSTLPGGFETGDATLPRKPARDYSDIERLATHRRVGAGGEVAYEGRLERAPRVSGDQVAISPSSVGWQAHLEDDKSVKLLGRDIDMSHWASMSVQYRLNLIASAPAYATFDAQTEQDATTGEPSVKTAVQGPWTNRSAAVAQYDAGSGASIGRIRYSWKRGASVDSANVNWAWLMRGADDDTMSTSLESDANQRAVGPASSTLVFTSAKRFAQAIVSYAATGGVDGLEYPIYWTQLIVYGDHGLTIRGLEPNAGFYDADLISYALTRWCPLLTYTSETLVPDPTFVIPQAAFLEPTTVGEIVRQCTRFSVRPWAVWEDKTFWLYDWGTKGRNWRARIGPAELEETGPQVDRLWNSIIVAYQDVDGSTRTVGPVGSGADTEDATLEDPDPENPATKLGINRRDMLVMDTTTPEGAIEVGSRFLEESKLLDSSGRATFNGYVEDDRGVVHPYWKVRAGDTVTFVDASDASARRVVRAENDHDGRVSSVDLDSPPEGLQALLERLNVALVPLGL